MLNGLLDLPVWGIVVGALILTHITIASVTIFLHRHQAHRALDLNPVVSHFFRFWLWLTTGMRTIEWVAVHRKHHVKCETEEDPHSPQIHGIRKVLWRGAELYGQETDKPETMEKYGKGTPNDWIERNLYAPWQNYGLGVMFLIDILLFGVAGISVWAVQMLWIPFWAAGVINGIGHYWGYRNYECKDASRNIVPWAIIVGGEELHNNHHTYPTSAKLSSKWWEFDIGWMYIRLLQAVRLAKVNTVAPKPVIGPAKPVIDMDTLGAVLTNRFQIMSSYYKSVVVPVLREEVKKANESSHELLRRAKKLLIREESLLNENAKQKLESALSVSQKLKIVYSYRQKLEQIWNNRGVSQENLLHALQDWCKQAEAAGIHYLEDFAQNLKGYTRASA
ncbi:MAG: fatty acid desaturase [Gammaproteobacteria bacterium]|jgi:stearoyl-CoA desaturase (delta-9 desaturase)|nr:fatty acid desaturase [Gammaproteobacteria bacterium]